MGNLFLLERLFVFLKILKPRIWNSLLRVLLFYFRYYGYRNPTNELDNRLICLSYHRYIFEGKDILDIGCNIGHITLCIARDFGAKSVLGIDIDKNLIGVARKNIKHYVNNAPPANIMDRSCEKKRFKKQNCEFFPISMPILYGPIDIPGINTDDAPQTFPNNVTFKQVNHSHQQTQSPFIAVFCFVL